MTAGSDTIRSIGEIHRGTTALLTFVRIASGFVAPILILVLTHFLAPRAIELPATLAGLRTWGPALALLLAGVLALSFNRGRVVFAVASLGVAFAIYQLILTRFGLSTFTARTAFAALCLCVPINLAILSVLQERGVFTHFGVRRGGTIVLQAEVTAWVIVHQYRDVTNLLYWPLLPAVVSPIPHFTLLLMAVGTAVAVGAAVASRTAIDASLAGALAAFAAGCSTVTLPNHFSAYVMAAGLMLAIAVVHDTYRLAFRDELTGLPSRRALNERLMSLGSHYTLAMLDVDHFKRFNDEWGHELGDHVLRMVARKVEMVGGGGRAYRYGGEEFAIVFAGRSLRDAWGHLEGLRKGVAAHRLAIRGPSRPVTTEPGLAQRGTGAVGQSVSVTISIGVAQRDERNTTPAEVLLAADRALYRAKDKGRNQCSR